MLPLKITHIVTCEFHRLSLNDKNKVLSLSLSWELFLCLLHCYYFLFFTKYIVSIHTRWAELQRVLAQAVTFTKGIGFSIHHTLFTMYQAVHSLRRNSIAKIMAAQTKTISDIDGNPVAATCQGTYPVLDISFSFHLF